ncbi:LacI family DNA-binding transcriptional regulator [Leifsonia shinshuensis]|uniref:LacI family transcriptional regulator n=1 Tax=Leifsonia shinshuensis TaxID=150026 RepID=A0A7G6Y9Y1_9MICO|nr:LacI family DNA-binding transcriptional regulator [Leifsonia shinshuensis]QNE35296.1 LacI family transcriptional regulator [Leifsonia shinshuensis]
MTETLPDGPAKQPTVREVALRAGVSPMTVSRTLAGGKNVRPDVQDRVLEAVRALGYHRNENARSLRPGHTSGLVGVAITNLGNPYYGNFALGVEEVAAQYGRRILLGNTGEDIGRERQLVTDFIGRQVEGLIVVPSGDDSAHLQQESLRDAPLVLASRTVDGVPADSVVLDDVGGARRGTAALIDAGHRRIAYLGNVSSVFTGQRRFEGYGQALEEAGIPVDPALVRRGQQDVETASAAMVELLAVDDPPTAVFSANNRNTIGAIRALSGRMAQGDRSALPAIVSFDDFELAELMPMPVTVVMHDPRELGRQAARLLFDRLLEHPDGPPRSIEMPTPLRVARA